MIDELQSNKWYSLKFSDYEVKRHWEDNGREGITLRVCGDDEEGFIYIPYPRADDYLQGFVMGVLGEGGEFELIEEETGGYDYDKLKTIG